jgi:small-conductance mechanosensitive channel
MTNKDNFHVRFNDFGESSLNILVIFYLMVPDYAAELREREAILLQIMDLAKEIGVEFAFPTRTLRVEGPSAAGSFEDAGISRGGVGAALDRVRTR